MPCPIAFGPGTNLHTLEQVVTQQRRAVQRGVPLCALQVLTEQLRAAARVLGDDAAEAEVGELVVGAGKSSMVNRAAS